MVHQSSKNRHVYSHQVTNINVISFLLFSIFVHHSRAWVYKRSTNKRHARALSKRLPRIIIYFPNFLPDNSKYQISIVVLGFGIQNVFKRFKINLALSKLFWKDFENTLRKNYDTMYVSWSKIAEKFKTFEWFIKK